MQDSKLGLPGKCGTPLQGLLRDWTTVRWDTLPDASAFRRREFSWTNSVMIRSFLPRCHSPPLSTVVVLWDSDLMDHVSKAQTKLVHQWEQLPGWHGMKLPSWG